MTGKLIGISDSLVLMRFENDSLLHAFEMKNLSRIRYKRGSGFIGGAIIGFVSSLTVNLILSLSQPYDESFRGLALGLVTIVPATTFTYGTVSAIRSDKTNIKFPSPSK